MLNDIVDVTCYCHQTVFRDHHALVIDLAEQCLGLGKVVPLPALVPADGPGLDRQLSWGSGRFAWGATCIPSQSR